MHAEDKSFSFLSAPNYYDIPFFQRAYVWNEENWHELLDNLMSKGRDHFLGSIILKNEHSYSGSVARFSVIDGQQRLTTLSILLRAIYDHIIRHASEYGYDDDILKTCQVKMEQLLFVPEGGIRQTLHVKINHSHLDKKAYEEIIKGDFASDDKWEKYTELPKDDNTSNIIKAYVYFRDELQNAAQDDIDALWELLTVDKIKFLVNIDLDQNDNEQAIFDTVNSAGVRLSSADTIKNLIYQKYVELLRALDPITADEEAVQVYNETWADAFLADEETSNYWDLQRQYGRMKRTNIETFLHAFAVVQEFFNPAEDNMADLPQKYRSKTASMSLDELHAFLMTLHDYAAVFREYFTAGDESFEYTDFICRVFNVCGALEVSTFYPYILKQLYNHKKDTITYSKLKANLFAIERYVILNAICGGSTKNYNNECLQMVSGRKSPEEIMNSCVYISEGNFVNGLRHMTTNKLPTLLLFWIELYQRHELNVDVKALKFEYTLEHIMPQKWEQNWSDVPSYDSDGNPVQDDDDIERVRSHAIYEIGNMTLLNSKLNTSISNGTFQDKINGKRGKKGIRDLADLRLTKEVIDKCATWDERNIYARTAELEGQIRKLWNAEQLPEETIVTVNKSSRDRHEIRLAFWAKALSVIKEKNHYESFSNVNPTGNNSVSGSFGISGFSIVCAANYDNARVDIYLGSNNVEKNKKAYDLLYKYKAEIESKLGAPLKWDRANDYKASWASYSLDGVSIANNEDWPKMANFLGEWSNKIRETIVPYLSKEFSQNIYGTKSPEQVKRLLAIASLLRKWAEENPDVKARSDKSNRTNTRFLTAGMSDILPDIKNAPSGWNTDNHYFYEIVNRSGTDVVIQLCFSSKNISHEQRELMNNINKISPMHQSKEDWQWWTAYKTDKVEIPEDLDEGSIFKGLDAALVQAEHFESELKQKLAI